MCCKAELETVKVANGQCSFLLEMPVPARGLALGLHCRERVQEKRHHYELHLQMNSHSIFENWSTSECLRGCNDKLSKSLDPFTFNRVMQWVLNCQDSSELAR